MDESTRRTGMKGHRTPGGAAAIADQRERLSGGGGAGMTALPEESPERSAEVAEPRHQGSFFEIYKPAQGYYTRLGTAIGGAILILGGARFVYATLDPWVSTETPWTQWVQYFLPFGLVALLGVLLFGVVGRKRTTCDFLIATEGEMKKVNWSTRNEIIGSTKVVIVFTLLLGLVLFLVDVAFIEFFTLINVLRGGGAGPK